MRTDGYPVKRVFTERVSIEVSIENTFMKDAALKENERIDDLERNGYHIIQDTQ